VDKVNMDVYGFANIILLDLYILEMVEKWKRKQDCMEGVPSEENRKEQHLKEWG
jgi:hypothetical protein